MSPEVLPADLLVGPAPASIHGGSQWRFIGPDPGRVGEYVLADVNDAWYAPAPATVDAMRRALERIQHTPEVHGECLRRLVAERLGQPEERILLGAGASPLLQRLILRACARGGPMLVPAPEYSEYQRVAEAAGAPVFRCALDHRTGLRIDPEKLAACAASCNAAVVVLSNPSNPAGQVLSPDAVGWLLERLPPSCLLLVDEAYIDHAPRASMLDQVSQRPKLAVVRSLSKGSALAGLRAGFASVGAAWPGPRSDIQQPWQLNLLAQAAFLPALDAGAYVAERIAETHRLRNRLCQDLAALPGLRILPTDVHFFLIELGPGLPPARKLVSRLAGRKVLVRDGTAFGPPLGSEWLRVTTRSGAENRRLVAAFAEVLALPSGGRLP
jgi:threonine-phosphate decarboxylase